MRSLCSASDCWRFISGASDSNQHALIRICAGVALALGVLMSALALDTDLFRSAGLHLWRNDPSDRLRGWKSATIAVEKIRNDLESKLGEKLFLIADERDRASEISFYLRDKRPAEGPGHPPVYILESQDLVNQFSFWPRYDEFVEISAAKPEPRRTRLHRGKRRKSIRWPERAVYSPGRSGTSAPQHQRRIRIDRAGWNNRSAPLRRDASRLAGFSVPKLSNSAVVKNE